MGTVLRAKLSKYRARVSEFEDDEPSSTVVRWLVVRLLLHLLVIGGVYVRSTWFRNTAETVEMAAALPAPPTVPQPSRAMRIGLSFLHNMKSLSFRIRRSKKEGRAACSSCCSGACRTQPRRTAQASVTFSSRSVRGTVQS